MSFLSLTELEQTLLPPFFKAGQFTDSLSVSAQCCDSDKRCAAYVAKANAAPSTIEPTIAKTVIQPNGANTDDQLSLLSRRATTLGRETWYGEPTLIAASILL